MVLVYIIRPAEGGWSRNCESDAEPPRGRAADQCFKGQDGSSVQLLQRQREGADAVCQLVQLAKQTTVYFAAATSVYQVVLVCRCLKKNPWEQYWHRCNYGCLPDKTKFCLALQLSLLRESRPKSARASPRQCTQSWFTFGGVIAKRVNTSKTRRKVNPIFGWSVSLSRITMKFSIQFSSD